MPISTFDSCFLASSGAVTLASGLASFYRNTGFLSLVEIVIGTKISSAFLATSFFSGSEVPNLNPPKRLLDSFLISGCFDTISFFSSTFPKIFGATVALLSNPSASLFAHKFPPVGGILKVDFSYVLSLPKRFAFGTSFCLGNVVSIPLEVPEKKVDYC